MRTFKKITIISPSHQADVGRDVRESEEELQVWQKTSAMLHGSFMIFSLETKTFWT